MGCPAQVSGSSTGAPLLLLAEEQELEAVRLWLASAAPKYEATQKEDAVKSRNVTWIFHEFPHAEIPQEEHIALADNVLACFA